MPTAVQQLRMGFTHFSTLTPPEHVPGYELRRFRPGDEDAWVALLATGDFGTWDRPRLDAMLAGERAPMPLAGIFFATYHDQPVGAACTFLPRDAHGELAEVGWVVVHPDHRGHGLGLQLCRAVLQYVRQLGHCYAFLQTEDFRVPAIKTYLRLGFEPEMSDPGHPAWWAAFLRTHAPATRMAAPGGKPT